MRAFPVSPRAVALALFLALATIGLALHRDYGVPWDEPAQRDYAQLVSRYVFGGNDRLFSDPMRDYGPAHEMVLLAAETFLPGRDSPERSAVRHLVNFLVFAVGCVFLYLLALAGTGRHVIGLVASLALVLSPRLFADAFYNSKDVPFLAVFVVAVYTLLRFLERPRAATVAVHALASAWLIAIRVPGVMVPALTVGAAVYCAIRARSSPLRGRLLGWSAVYLAMTAVLTVAFWPTLWREPVSSFWHALETMSRFPWPQDVLYGGRFLPATDLPWHYAPVWIAISTPLLYLAGFCLGLPAILRSAAREIGGPTSIRGVYSAIVLAWLVGPLVAAIVFDTVLYDGWRQIFFVYPALLLIAAEGFDGTARALRRRWDRPPVRVAAVVAAACVIVGLGGIVRFMVAAHPHQQVFFNVLVGGVPGARFNYELDYWGLSYRRGLEAILRLDEAPLIAVAVADPPGEWYAPILPRRDRERLVFVDVPDEAKYFIGAYRWRQEEYPFRDVIHRELVDGAAILSVALVNPRQVLTPESVPAVAEARATNAAIMAGVADSDVHATVRDAITESLAHFVRGAERFEVDLFDATTAELREGRVAQLRLRVHRGDIGDFRRRPDGVPVERLDVTLGELVVDLSRLMHGELRPVRLDSVTVADLVVDGQRLNDLLRRGRGEGQRLQVHIEGGAIRVARAGTPGVDATIRLWVGPDPWRPDSDNLFFEMTSVRVGGWRLPVAGLLQRLAGSAFSPVIGPEGFEPRLVLGTLTLDEQRIRLGTPAGP